MAPFPRLLLSRNRTLLVAGFLLLLLMPTPARAQSSPSWLQRLRDLLGLQPRVAVAGSRSEAGAAITGQLCLISPWRAAVIDGQATAITPTGAPPIVTREPLAEVRILRGERLIWRRRGSSNQSIQTPLAWPLDPLLPGETVTLKFRPEQSNGGDFAVVRLSRSATATADGQALSEGDAARWHKAIQTLSMTNRPAEAVELLFRGSIAGIPDLRQQAMELIGSACSTMASGSG